LRGFPQLRQAPKHRAHLDELARDILLWYYHNSIQFSPSGLRLVLMKKTRLKLEETVNETVPARCSNGSGFWFYSFRSFSHGFYSRFTIESVHRPVTETQTIWFTCQCMYAVFFMKPSISDLLTVTATCPLLFPPRMTSSCTFGVYIGRSEWNNEVRNYCKNAAINERRNTLALTCDWGERSGL
jgi:hypothetical protein